MGEAAVTEGILCSHLAGVEQFSGVGGPQNRQSLHPVGNWPAAVPRVACRGQPQSTKTNVRGQQVYPLAWNPEAVLSYELWAGSLLAKSVASPSRKWEKKGEHVCPKAAEGAEQKELGKSHYGGKR